MRRPLGGGGGGGGGPFSSSTTRAIVEIATSRRALRLIALFALLAFLLAFSLVPSSATTTTVPEVTSAGGSDGTSASPPCKRRAPRVVSHRGVDQDDHAGAAFPSTLGSIQRLLDEGIGSFDLDLFWPADDHGKDLFVGHPPSLRQRWRLEDELHATTLAHLERVAKPDGGLLRLADLLQLLARRRGAVGLVSFELKYPAHAEWQARLRLLYSQVAASGLPAVNVAGVALDVPQARAHRDAQAASLPAHGRSGLVVVLRVLKDLDAPLGADGERHADLNAVARDDGHFDGWSASVRLLDAPLRTAASTAAKPLAVWTVDDEPSLRRAFSHGPDDVVTNRARWARRTLERWRKEECTHSR